MKLVSFENLLKYNELLSQKTVKSVNSVKPDSTGNVTLGTEKSTFNKVEFDTGYFSIGTAKTYSFDLTGTDLENVPKENVNIRLVAKVTKAHNGFEVGDIAQLSPGLDISPDWYELGVCAYIRGNTLYVYSGNYYGISIVTETGKSFSKSNVQIKAVLTAFIPDDGSIQLIAEDQNNTSKLIGLPDGTLTWKDKNLVRSVNGVNADESGNVSITTVANATTSSKLQNARVLTINDTRDNLGAGVSFDGSKNVTISLPPYIATQLLKDKTKCFGNDYYDDSDITSLIYAGNGSGTVRAELAAGNFERLHPGQYIKGRVTGTTYIVVGCNVYLNRGDTSLTRNHLGLIPIQLVGNTGNLLWSGKQYQGASTNNSIQGYAPWNADNENVGKNVTCAYKDSYMAKTVIPKVINNWLKKDFEEQGISVLTFRNLFSTGFDANLPCMSYPAWKGACLYAEWADCKAVLMSEPEVYGGYRWASSPYDSHMQHLQLPLFRHRSIHEIIYADIWLKDVASVSYACKVHWNGHADTDLASFALRVCPLFLIA